MYNFSNDLYYNPHFTEYGITYSFVCQDTNVYYDLTPEKHNCLKGLSHEMDFNNVDEN